MLEDLIVGVLEDFRKWLKEIPIWQELEKVPGRMTELEKRMAALEDRLKTRPGETCPKCGEHAMRLSDTGRIIGPMGQQQRTDHWTCGACGRREARVVSFR
jgi:hypothetical protein